MGCKGGTTVESIRQSWQLGEVQLLKQESHVAAFV